MLASAIHQHESALEMHMPPPFLTSFPPPTPSHPSRLSQRPRLSFLSHTANSYWLSILHMIVYMFLCHPLHSSHRLLSLLPSLTSISVSPFSMSASPLLPCKWEHQYHLSRFHIYALIYIYVFLSDLLHSM